MVVTFTSSSHPLRSWVIDSNPSSTKSSTLVQPDIKKLQSLNTAISLRADYSKADKSVLPDHFDPHNNIWKNLLFEPSDQGVCGSCWAFASSMCLSDRFNVIKGLKWLKSPLSPTVQILCNDFLEIFLNNDDPEISNIFQYQHVTLQKQACFGNSLIVSFLYLKLLGAPTIECFPYNTNIYNLILNNDYIGLHKSIDAIGQFGLGKNKIDNFQDLSDRTQSLTCDLYNHYSFTYPFKFCLDSFRHNGTFYYGTPSENFKSLFNYTIRDGHLDSTNIQYDIFKFGPVASSFVVYDDFYSFNPSIPEAVYIHDDRDTRVIGGHAVEIVGWGTTTKGIPFWWIKNSWGTRFGKNGYFRFLRGSDHCSIETNVISCIPNFFFDFKHPLYVQQFYSKILTDTFFSVNPDSSLPLIKLLSQKVMKLSTFNYFVITEEMYDDAFEKYGIFTNDIINTLGYMNSSFPIGSGYDSINIRYMPGLSYNKNQNQDSYEFLFSPSFFAGFHTQQRYNPSFLSYLFVTLFFFLLTIILVSLFFRFKKK